MVHSFAGLENTKSEIQESAAKNVAFINDFVGKNQI